MRKFFAPLILSLFFFIPFKVSANTYTYNLSPSVYDIFTADGFYDFFNNNFSNATNYAIQKSDTQFLFYIDTNISSYSCSNGGVTFAYCSASPPGSTTWKEFSFPPFVIKGTAYDSWKSKNLSYSSSSYIIASSTPLVASDFNTYVFNIGDETYSCGTPTEHCIFPTLLDLYKMHHSDPTLPPEPEPEDNTPLLTTFYTVVIDKIGEICTFFTSNYLYLSVFVIFLFYISILLLRRFIK